MIVVSTDRRCSLGRSALDRRDWRLLAARVDVGQGAGMVRRVLLALPLLSMLVFALPAQAMVDAAQSGSPLVTPTATLAAALRCHDTPSRAGHEPVLLVHGITCNTAMSRCDKTSRAP